MAVPSIPSPQQPVYAAAIKGDNATIWSASGDPGAALDGDFQEGTILPTGHATALACTFKYDCNGSAAVGNQAEFFFSVSNAATAPAIGDDEWVVLPHEDVTPTAADQADGFPAGFDATATPEWGRIVTRPGYFQTHTGGTSSSEKLRFGLVVNVRYWKFIVLLAKESGEPGNAGTLVVDGAFIVG